MKTPPDPQLIMEKFKRSWRRAFLNLIHLGGISSGNHVEILHDGDQIFSTIIMAINSAKQSIFFETYIFLDDRVGLWVRDALISAAGRGVSVALIYDHFGSAHLSSGFVAPMKKAGIKVVEFNPIWPWRR